MIRNALHRPVATGLAILAVSFAASAQTAPATTPATSYEPSVGQAGKDVVWVPTPQALVDTMLNMAKVTRSDYVIDLGSGDGRLVITAAKRGARALGIEYEPQMVELARRNARKAGVSARATFVKQDLFESDFSKATVVTMFLLPEINLRLRPTILKLKPGTRVVSNSFTMGDWEPDQRVQLTEEKGCETNWCTALLWIVPADVAGKHKVPQGDLVLEQTYQSLKGTLATGNSTVPVEGKVIGEQVVLKAGGREWRGRYDGKRLAMQPGVIAPSLGAVLQPATAAAPPGPYQPSVGQPGKDVVWVPTPQVLVDKMLDMAKMTPDDYVIDLGSGDGRTVITAAKRGANALGIEYEGEMVVLSRRNAQQAGVADRATFVQQDLFESDLSKATVITMFLLPAINLKLRPKILSLKPGTRIVSNSFPMGDWEPDEKVEMTQEKGCETHWCTALLWIVPARVVGTHETKYGELVLDQSFQKITGTLKTGDGTMPVEGRVIGEEVVVLTGSGRELRGRVSGTRVTLL